MPEAFPNFAWAKSSEGSFCRAVTGYSIPFSTRGTDGKYTGVAVGAHLKPTLSKTRDEWSNDLKRAWLLTRFDFPVVGSVLRADQQGQYTSYRPLSSDHQAAEWAKETILVQDVPPVGVETFLLDGHLSGLRDDVKLCAYFDPGDASFYLAICGSHAVFDGEGLFAVLRSVLKYLSSDTPAQGLPWGQETTRLPLTVETLCGWRTHGVPLTKSEDAGIEKSLEFYKEAAAKMGSPATVPQLPHMNAGAAAAECHRFQHTWSVDDSRRIFKAARKAGVKIGQLLIASGFVALYRVIRDSQANIKPEQVIQARIPVDTRRLVAAEKQSQAPFAFRGAHVPVSVQDLAELSDKIDAAAKAGTAHVPYIERAEAITTAQRNDEAKIKVDHDFCSALLPMQMKAILAGMRVANILSFVGSLDVLLGATDARSNGSAFEISQPFYGTISNLVAIHFYSTSWQEQLGVTTAALATHISKDVAQAAHREMVLILSSLAI